MHLLLCAHFYAPKVNQKLVNRKHGEPVKITPFCPLFVIVPANSKELPKRIRFNLAGRYGCLDI